MPSRRNLIEMSDSELDQYLTTSKTLIIVSNGRNGFPHPMPMWYYAKPERTCYCTTFTKSQKVLNFRRDPKATLLIESGLEYSRLKGLVIYAETEVIEDRETVVDTMIRVNDKNNGDLSDSELKGLNKTAEKRVALKFTPLEFVSWDHTKLQGVY